jgi:uncharacterized protein (TIGR02265 family)
MRQLSRGRAGGKIGGAMPSANTKGSHVLSAVKALRMDRGRALSLLPSHLHGYLEERIMPSSWYPMEDHLGLLQAIAKMLPPSPDPWVFIGRRNAQLDMAGIYRGHLRVGDPQRTLITLASLWRSAYDTGDVTVATEGERVVITTMRNFGVVSRGMCLCIVGYLSEAVALSGGKEAETQHPRCRAQGADACVWRTAWS